MSVLREVRCQWASVIEPNTKFEHRWEIDAILSDEQAAQLVDLGLKIKDDKGVKTYRFKRKCGGTKRDGTPYKLSPPNVVDAAKVKFEKLIGNGSLVNIGYSIRKGEMMGTPFCKGDLDAVQVLELVEYGGGGGVDEFSDEGEVKIIEGDDDNKVVIDEEDIF